MGIGSYRNRKFNFVVSAQGILTDADKALWQAQFLTASQVLYQATEGMLSFGNIYIADAGYGAGICDFSINEGNGIAYATYGLYGMIGRSIQLFDDNRTGNPNVLVHEFAHHAFGLGDEYTGPVSSDDIDPTVTFPEWDESPPYIVKIPLLEATVDPSTLNSAEALLLSGGGLSRMLVKSYDGVLYNDIPDSDAAENMLTVFGNFLVDPRGCSEVFYQPKQRASDGRVITCGAVGDATCIMDDSSKAEFCARSNHEGGNTTPNGDTSQHALHGKSCWEVIEEVMAERYNDDAIVAPDPAVTQLGSAGFPNFFDLVKENRVAIVLDKSGSMNDDNKFLAAQFGVDTWIRQMANNAVQDNWLSVIWYNAQQEVTLPLQNLNNVADLESTIASAINTQAEGWTNIRDALDQAIDEIESRDGRAALQAVVLLTDGIHNRPEGTSMLEVIPSLQDAGIAVYVVALGTPENMNFEELEMLATQTGGAILDVIGTGGGDDSIGLQRAVIGVSLGITFHQLHNGLVVVDGQSFAPASPEERGRRDINKKLNIKNAKVEVLFNAYGVDGLAKLGQSPGVARSKMLVEKGAINLNISHFYDEADAYLFLLITPDNKVLLKSGDAGLSISSAPMYTNLLVPNPKPGYWSIVSIKLSGGKSVLNTVGGVENRKIVCFADCVRSGSVSQAIEITAGARWGDALSGLKVKARLTGPGGETYQVDLNDDLFDSPMSGDYKGHIVAHKPGRYTGYVDIYGTGKSLRAGGMYRLQHVLDEKVSSIDLRIDAPRFKRTIPIYFDMDNRGEIHDADIDRIKRHPPIRKRKNKLDVLDITKALSIVERRNKAGLK